MTIGLENDYVDKYIIRMYPWTMMSKKRECFEYINVKLHHEKQIYIEISPSRKLTYIEDSLRVC